MNKVLAVLFILLLIALWQLWPVSEKAKPHNQPNTVSFVGDSNATSTAGSAEGAKPNIDTADVFNDLISSDPYLNKAPKELTYMDVYRMKRLYAQCHDVIYGLLEVENYDVVDRFEKSTAHFTKDLPNWPTTHQYQAAARRATQCELLLKQVQALELPPVDPGFTSHSSYLGLQKQLSDFLNTIPPNSNQALKIADVLSLIDMWQQHYQNVLDLSKGDKTINAGEIETIRAKIKLLRLEQQQLSSQMQEPDSDPEIAKELPKIWQKIWQLNRQITELSLIDPAARNAALADFEVANSELFNRLRSPDPNVFYETQMAMERNNVSGTKTFGHYPYKNIGKGQFKMPFIEYVSPGDVFKNMTGIGDNEIFGLVINHATLLYLCELGADCGPNSEWIQTYCISPSPQMDPVSCELDLPTYYRQHLLNQNQWHDVQTVLSLIRGAYAE